MKIEIKPSKGIRQYLYVNDELICLDWADRIKRRVRQLLNMHTNFSKLTIEIKLNGGIENGRI